MAELYSGHCAAPPVSHEQSPPALPPLACRLPPATDRARPGLSLSLSPFLADYARSVRHGRPAAVSWTDLSGAQAGWPSGRRLLRAAGPRLACLHAATHAAASPLPCPSQRHGAHVHRRAGEAGAALRQDVHLVRTFTVTVSGLAIAAEQGRVLKPPPPPPHAGTHSPSCALLCSAAAASLQGAQVQDDGPAGERRRGRQGRERCLRPRGVDLPPPTCSTTALRALPPQAIEAARTLVSELQLEGRITPEQFLIDREEALDRMFPEAQLLPGAGEQGSPAQGSAVPCRATRCSVAGASIGSQPAGTSAAQQPRPPPSSSSSPPPLPQSACCGTCTRTACPCAWPPRPTCGTIHSRRRFMATCLRSSTTASRVRRERERPSQQQTLAPRPLLPAPPPAWCPLLCCSISCLPRVLCRAPQLQLASLVRRPSEHRQAGARHLPAGGGHLGAGAAALGLPRV